MREFAARLQVLSVITLTAVVLAGDRDAPPTARQAPVASLSVPFLASDDPAGVAAFHAWTFAGPVVVKRDGAIAYAIGGTGGDASSGAWRKTSTRATPRVVITERLAGATPVPSAGARSSTNVSVLRGERSQWRDSVPSFDAVELGEAWPGIRVTLQARASSVEKVFTVAPGVSPDAIRIDLDGVDALRIDDAGRLVAATAGGDVAYSAPVAWQEGWLGRTPVDVAYAIDGASYGFVVGGYDRTRPLWIDPLLQSSYAGGSSNDFDGVEAIAVHPSTGDVYVLGNTASTDFPAVAGGADPSLTDGNPTTRLDCFVARFSAALTTLIQATYFGGDNQDACTALAIHPTTGEIYIGGSFVGLGSVPGLPGGADTTSDVSGEGFVARLSPALTSIGQSTLLGGSGYDRVLGLAFDAATGDVYAAGETASGDFPGLAGGVDTVVGNGKAFVARLPASLTGITQSTFFGGISRAYATDIAVHPTTGDVYIVGNVTEQTDPGDITGVAGGADTTRDTPDGYVARLNGALTAVLQSTYVGGSGTDIARGIAIHPINGDVYVVGETDSAVGFPGLAGGADTTAVSGENYVVRLTPSLTSIVQSTLLGGDGEDGFLSHPSSIAIHPATGDVYVVSSTDDTTGFPAIGSAEFQAVAAGVDGVVARLNAGLTSVLQSTLVGGTDYTATGGVAISPLTGDVYVGGRIDDDVPGTLPRLAGAGDATKVQTEGFVVRFASDLAAAPLVVAPVPANAIAALALLVLAVLAAYARVAARGRRAL